MARDTVVDRLFENARRIPASVALRHRDGERWRSISWQEYAGRARRFGQALIAAGVMRSRAVTILGGNRWEWLVADTGAMAVGCVPAGIYQTCTPEQVAYVIRHAESPVCVVEDVTQWRKVESQLVGLPALQRVVLMHEADSVQHPLVVSFEAFLKSGDGWEDAFQQRFDAIADEDLATLIYTSGTTGPPKGAMLTHRNLAWMARTGLDLVARSGEAVTPDDATLSYLPLSHIAEQLFSLHLPITGGYTVWIARSLETLRDDLVEARPTVFLAVPRVWEKMQAALTARFQRATGVKSALLAWARGVGAQVGELRKSGRRPTGLLALQYQLATRLVFSKLKGALGFDRARMLVTGAAPISCDTLDFFLSLDMLILEAYGQSENTGGSSFNAPGQVRFGTVGRPLPGLRVRIAEDGEILVSGPDVFAGYFRDPAQTAEVLRDGWLHSGDIGEFDAEGYLRITDRKKDLIITAGGKNVAPQNIETQVRELDLVSQCVVVGDRRPYLVALVTLHPEAAPAFARTHGLGPEKLSQDPRVRAHLQAGIDRVNARLARYETIKKFQILDGDFTVEGGELTPTMKIKRKVVSETYADVIERLYAGDS